MNASHPTVTQLLERAAELRSCCLHSEAFARAATVSEVIGTTCKHVSCNERGVCVGPPSCNEISDSDRVWLFTTKDGRFGVFEESEDYTGHG